MTLDEVIAALSRGHCSEARAREAGCALCVPRFDAIAEVRRWHETREALRDLFDAITAKDAFPVTTAPDGSDAQLVENPRITSALVAARRAMRQGEP